MYIYIYSLGCTNMYTYIHTYIHSHSYMCTAGVSDVRSRYKHTPSVMHQWVVKFKKDVSEYFKELKQDNPQVIICVCV